MNEIIKTLALSIDHDGETIGELWSTFFGELDSHHLNPKDITPPNPKESVYEYDSGGGRKAMTYGEFSIEIAQYRRSK
jgi:hypothetical protein